MGVALGAMQRTKPVTDRGLRGNADLNAWLAAIRIMLPLSHAKSKLPLNPCNCQSKESLFVWSHRRIYDEQSRKFSHLPNNAAFAKTPLNFDTADA